MRPSLLSAAAALSLAALPIFAQQPQLKLPRASQSATVRQTVGLTDITIAFSRPGVKGRQVWGSLVPYDKVWRTGANEATTITFTDDVKVEGQELKAGKYALMTIPTTGEWTVIFNKDADQWGAYSYDEKKDVLRVKVKPEAAPFTEWMTFDFPSVTTDAATVEMRWDKVAVPFHVTTDTTARTMAGLRTAVAGAKADDWRTPMRAAQFAYENKVSGDEAAKWLAQSLKVQENTMNLFLQSRVEAGEGKKKEAIATAEKAIAKATPQDKEEVEEIKKNIEMWKK